VRRGVSQEGPAPEPLAFQGVLRHRAWLRSLLASSGSSERVAVEDTGVTSLEASMDVDAAVDDDTVSALQSSAVLVSARRSPPAGNTDIDYYDKAVNPWRVIYSTSRAKYDPNAGRDESFYRFIDSVPRTEWLIFGTAMPLMICLHYYLVDWPSTKRYHGLALFIWFGVGGLYLSIVWTRLGYAMATQWVTAYMLELIFSIEDVFVFHVVVSAFKAPTRATQKALFILICCQIAFQGTCYCGFASALRAMVFLPYVLGTWLIYAGYQAAISEAHADINIKETAVYKYIHGALGDRLIGEYVHNENNRHQAFVWREDPEKPGEDKLYVTMLGPLLICMIMAAWMLEIDATLTIIEQIENEYIAFSACAVASWCVPELYFVARDLFQRYFLLKYGVGFILIFFGLEMLLHEFVHIPDIIGVLIMLIAMAICMVVSHCIGLQPSHDSDEETEKEAPEKNPKGTGADFPAAQNALYAAGGDDRLPQ